MTLTLSPYQELTVERLLSNKRYGVFDEMGVGKTPPAIMAAAARSDPRWPTLVTVPAFLAANWARELRKWAPSAVVASAVVDDPKRKQEALNSNADFILTSYNSWYLYPVLLKRRWNTLLFDEAHRLRGHQSQWTKRVFATQNVEAKSRDAAYWFLTGTPLVANAGDIWPFLHLMDRQLYGSYHRFVDTMCLIEFTPWDKVIGPVRDPEAFTEILRRYSIRRLQKDIPELAELDHVTKLIPIPLPSSVVAAIRRAKKEYTFEHDDVLKEYDSAGGMLQDILQMCSVPPTQANPKFDAVMDFLANDRSNTRVVVYTWYKATAAALAERIQKAMPKRFVGKITGDVRTSLRAKYEEQYNANPRAILVANIAAAKEGLNLQAGHTCAFVEESDLQADNDQAIGRMQRRGQEHLVEVFQFFTQGWPEQSKHRAVLKGERNIAHALMEELRTITV
jgi:SNF2 family DNA or RNA helicase